MEDEENLDQQFEALKRDPFSSSEKVGKGVFLPGKLEKQNSFDWSWTGTATAFSELEPEVETTDNRVSWFSQFTFGFFSPLMSKGWEQKGVKQSDVPMYSPYGDSFELEHDEFKRIFHEACEEKDKKGNPISPSKAFRNAIWRQHKSNFGMGALMFVFQRAFSFVKPFVIGRLASFFASDDDDPSLGYILANVFALSSLLNLVFTLQVFFYGLQVCVSLRQTISRMIFDKTLYLAPEKEGDLDSGKIVNMMNVDAEAISNYFVFMIQGFGAPVDMVISTILLCFVIGVEALVVLAVIILIFVFISQWGPVIANWQRKALACKDRRAKYIGEVLHGIKLFKLYAWEEVLQQRVFTARADEISTIKGYYRRFFLFFAINQNADVLFLLAIFGIYYAQGKAIDLETIFVAIGLISILTNSVFFSGFLLQQIFPLLVSIGRVSKFLKSKEVEEYVEAAIDDAIAFEFHNATLSYHDEKETDNAEEKDEAKTEEADAGGLSPFQNQYSDKT